MFVFYGGGVEGDMCVRVGVDVWRQVIDPLLRTPHGPRTDYVHILIPTYPPPLPYIHTYPSTLPYIHAYLVGSRDGGVQVVGAQGEGQLHLPAEQPHCFQIVRVHVA